ncbi:MAG: histidine kinase [Chitinophagaceae bacterium]
MKQVWYQRKWVIVLTHAVLWIVLFSLPFLLRPYNDKENAEHHKSSTELIQYMLSNAGWIAFFYLNAYMLVPRLLSKNKNWQYTTAIIIVFPCIILYHYLLYALFPGAERHGPDTFSYILINLFIYLFFSATSLAFRLISDKTRDDRISKEKENENLKTELSLLRSQASPHFMFNVLNNMVALARKKSDLLEPSLIKLSSLIRYTVYEANAEKVLLEKEIDYLESYIDLQRQRFGSNVQFNIHFDEVNDSSQIEPMLLIPFVENAIKHGTGYIEDAQIDVDLKVKNNVLFFSVRNRYSDAVPEIKDATSGIGLANVQRRLELLYLHQYKLTIDKTGGWFSVSLQLPLH